MLSRSICIQNQLLIFKYFFFLIYLYFIGTELTYLPEFNYQFVNFPIKKVLQFIDTIFFYNHFNL